MLRLVQLDNPSQFACPNPSVAAASINSPCQTEWRSMNNEELHDRLPSYYTALAPSRSAPWIPPASQQVFNKLPAYITDIAPLDAADVATCGIRLDTVSYMLLCVYLMLRNGRWVCRSTGQKETQFSRVSDAPREATSANPGS